MRRLSVVVRDRRWGTVAPRVDRLEVAAEAGGFSVRAGARCAGGGVDVRWEALVRAEAKAIECELELLPLADFEYNRMGLVVLHPVREAAGCRFRAAAGDGPEARGRLPEAVGPQLLREGSLQPLFDPFERLELEWPGGARLRFELSGDLFEMEDQRNWADGSFKTYSTPLGLGFPHRARAGEELRQRLRLEVVQPPGARPRARRGAGPVEVVSEPADARMPQLGVAFAAAAAPGDQAMLEAALADLAPSHLRVEPGEELRSAAARAAAAGVPIELPLVAAEAEDAAAAGTAVTAGTAAAAGIVEAAGAKLARVLVPAARPGAAKPARSAWPAVPVLGASDDHFAELNREPPAPGAFDGLAFPLSPQVHQFDDDTLRESLEALEAVAASAAALAAGGSVHVTPLTLRPRHGPGSEARDGDPAGVDSRQRGDFAAAWTLGAIAALGLGGAASITAYELFGPRGVLDSDGRLYPVGELLAVLAPLAGLPLRRPLVSEPMKLAVLLVEHRTGPITHLANLTAEPLEARVDGVPVALAPYGRACLSDPAGVRSRAGAARQSLR